jgi:hypothetical protein
MTMTLDETIADWRECVRDLQQDHARVECVTRREPDEPPTVEFGANGFVFFTFEFHAFLDAIEAAGVAVLHDLASRGEPLELDQSDASAGPLK